MADTDFVPTAEEIAKITNALKDDEFKKLFVEYVQELNDPENRKKYEEDIKALENERGVNVTFLNPSPGYVLKSSVNGLKKCFINVCHNENIGKPQCVPSVNGDTKGFNWSIPHTLSPPREDYDKSHKKCIIYDVLFHPDTFKLACKNETIRKLVESIAIESVEKSFNVTVDKTNMKYPKLDYKGVPKASVIRNKIENFSVRSEDDLEWDKKLNYPPMKTNMPTSGWQSVKTTEISGTQDTDNYTVPKYTITYRNHVDMQDFVNCNVSEPVDKVPSEIYIVINLPLLKSSETLDLDVDDKKLSLECNHPAKYKLEINLTYLVDKQKGNAKFDQEKRQLLVTLMTLKTQASQVINQPVIEKETEVSAEKDQALSNGNTELLLEEKVDEGLDINDGEGNADIVEQNEGGKDWESVCYLDPALKYTVPEHSCSIFGSRGCFTLKVVNIVDNTVKHMTTHNSLWVQFATLGSGHYPVHYSFFVEFPNVQLIKEECVYHLSTDVMNIMFEKANEEKFSKCLIGYGPDNAKETTLAFGSQLSSMIEDLECSAGNKLECPYEVEVTHDENKCLVEVNFDKQHLVTNANKCRHSSGEISPSYEQSLISIRKQKVRSFSESGDSLAYSGLHSRRGILKYKRSFSESSDDMAYWSQQDLNFSLDSDIPEESEGDDRVKKTVRFNDKIHEQLYRSTSSILGKKKKNQRKVQKKKRAARRASESEASASEAEFHSDDVSDSVTGTIPNHRSVDDRTMGWNKSEPNTESDVSDKVMSDPGTAPQNTSQKKKNRKKRNKAKTTKPVQIEPKSHGANPLDPSHSDLSELEICELTNDLTFALDE